MMKTNTVLIAVVLAVLAAESHAQVVYMLDNFGSNAAYDSYLPSTSYPQGGPGLAGSIPLPMTAALVAGTVTGGIAIDQATSRIFCTDGFTITTDYHSLYLPFTPLPLMPPPAPAPLLLSGGPLSGLGANPSAGMLWMTDGVSFASTAINAPFPILFPPSPFPFPIPAGDPMSGIDFDEADGTLWGTSLLGNIYHWIPGGPALGVQPVATVPSPVGLPITGLAVNDSNGPGSLAPHFCSTQLPGYHVVVTDGLLIYDALNPLSPVLTGNGVNGACHGLAYSNDMQYTPGAGVAPVLVGDLGWAKPQNNGSGGGNAISIVGAEPLTTVLLCYDNCPIPGGLSIPLTAETLWLNPFSVTFGFTPLVTDPLGNASIPLLLAPSPTGLNLMTQALIYSPTSPLGYATSDAMRFVVGTK